MQKLMTELVPLSGEVFRYGLVSALGLAVDLILLVALTEILHIPYLYSAAIGFIAGAVVVYVLSIGWVFQARTCRGKPSSEFLMFVSIGLVGLLLNQAILLVGTDVLALHYTASKALAISFVFTWNFTARKALLFSKEAHP